MKQTKTDIKRAFGSWGFIAGIGGMVITIIIGVAGDIIPLFQNVISQGLYHDVIKADTLNDTY